LESIGLWFGGMVWPVTLLAFGAALVWERSSAESRTRISTLAGAGKSRSRIQIIIGATLMAAGVVVILTSLGSFQSLGPVAIAILLTAVGFMLVFGPWALGLFDDLSKERHARIRSEERAELAAHLHDSVLQTLALIQRSDDPQHMTTLARAQERDLRSWLFTPERDHAGETVGEAVTAAAAKVEAAFDVPIEVVVVGDRQAVGESAPLIAAAAEAMANAAEHSGASQVSVYVECSPESVEAWITDHGVGFDLDQVGDDRKGITESILARMKRSGGNAEITSGGEGTEVHLITGASP
jgi:signal transduction histidine kinase